MSISINLHLHKNYLIWVIVLSIVLSFLSNTTLAEDIKSPILDQSKLKYVPEEVLVKFKSNLTYQNIQSVLKEYNLTIIDIVKQIELYHLKTPADKSVLEIVDLLTKDKRIEYAQPNWIYRINQADSKLEELQNQPAYQLVHLKEAIEFMRSLDLDYSKVMVVVVDSGIKKDHPFFSPEDFYDPGEKFITDFVDIHLPLDYRVPGEDYKKPDNKPEDYVGHGTHVAGIVKTVTDGKIKIWPFRAGFAPLGEITTSAVIGTIVTAVDEAAKQGIRLIFNFSFGRNKTNPLQYEPYYDAIRYAQEKGQAVFVGSAGNDSKEKINYPAAFSEVIAVGATNEIDKLADISNRGDDIIFAPGEKINSSTLEGFEKWSGTSMAAPFISGVVGYLLAIDPNLSLEEINSLLNNSTDLMNPFYAGYKGKRINVYKLVTGTFSYSIIKKIMDIVDNKTKVAIERFTEQGERDILEAEYLEEASSLLTGLIDKKMVSQEVEPEVLNVVEDFLGGRITEQVARVNLLLKLWEYGNNPSIAIAISVALKELDPTRNITELFVRKTLKSALEILAKTDFDYALDFLEEDLKVAAIVLAQMDHIEVIAIVEKLVLYKESASIIEGLIKRLEEENPLMANIVSVLKLLMGKEITISDSEMDNIKILLQKLDANIVAYLFDKGNPEIEAKILENLEAEDAAEILTNTKLVTIAVAKEIEPANLAKIFEEMASEKAKEIVIKLLEEAQTESIITELFLNLPLEKSANIITKMQYREIADLIEILFSSEEYDLSEKMEQIADILKDLNPLMAKIVTVVVHLVNKEPVVTNSDIANLKFIYQQLDADFLAYIIDKGSDEVVAKILTEFSKELDFEEQAELLKTLFKLRDIIEPPNFITESKEVIADVLENINIKNAVEIIKAMSGEYVYLSMAHIFSNMGPQRSAEIISKLEYKDIAKVIKETKELNGIEVIESIIDELKILDSLKAEFSEAIILDLHNEPEFDRFIDILSKLDLNIAALLIKDVEPEILDKISEKMGNEYAVTTLRIIFENLTRCEEKEKMDKWLEKREEKIVNWVKERAEIISKILEKVETEKTSKMLLETYSTEAIAYILDKMTPKKTAGILTQFNIVSEDFVDIIQKIQKLYGLEISINRIADELENLNHLTEAKLIKVITIFYKKDKSLLTDLDVQNTEFVLNKLGPEIITYIISQSIDELSFDKEKHRLFEIAAGLLEKIALSDSVRILKELDYLFDILQKMEKQMAINILLGTGSDVAINRLDDRLLKLEGEEERYVVKVIEWLLSLEHSIATEIIEDIVKLDSRWEDLTKMIHFFRSGKTEVGEAEIQMFKTLVEKFRPESIGEILNDANSLVVVRLLESIGEKPELIAYILYTGYDNDYSRIAREILTEMKPELVAAIVNQYKFDFSGFRAALGVRLWINYELLDTPKEWLSRMMDTLTDLDSSLALRIMEYLFGGVGRSRGDTFDPQIVVDLIDLKILVKIIEDAYYPRRIAEMFEDILHNIGSSFAVDVLLNIELGKTVEILSEIYNLRDLVNLIMELVSRNIEIANNMKEESLAQGYVTITAIFDLTMLVLNDEPIIEQTHIDSVEHLLGEKDIIIAWLLDKGKPEARAILFNLVKDLNYEASVKILSKTNSETMANIFTQIADYQEAIDMAKEIIQFARKSGSLILKLKRAVGYLEEQNPQLAEEIEEILRTETTITIAGRVIDPDTGEPKEDVKVEAYLAALGYRLMTTNIYSTFSDAGGKYELKIPLLDADESLILPSTWWDSYMIVVKAEGYTNPRILEISPFKVPEELLEKKIDINFDGKPLSQEEMSRRVIIIGEVVNPVSKTPEENIEVSARITAIKPHYSKSTPAFISRSKEDGSYIIEVLIPSGLRDIERWDLYKITVKVEGYKPIEIEIPAEEAEEKLFGQIITIPPPEPIEQASLSSQENVNIAINQDNKNDFTSDSIFTFTPSWDYNNPFYNPFTLW